MNMTMDQTQELAHLFANPHRFLSIISKSGTTEQIERYLNDRGTLSQLSDYPAWIAVVPERDAQFFADRLASGLHGAKVHDTFDEAQSHLIDNADLFT